MADLPSRGEVWWVNLEPVVGSEANKTRPIVVFSSADFNRLPVRVVVPFTSWNPRFANHAHKVFISANTTNGLEHDSAADGLQIRAVSLERFTIRVGMLTDAELSSVAAVVALVTGLELPGAIETT